MDDTTTEVVRQLRNMGLYVDILDESPDGMWLHVLIPALESVASGNHRKHN